MLTYAKVEHGSQVTGNMEEFQSGKYHHSAFWSVHFDCCIKVQCAEMKGMEETRMTSVSGLST